MNEIKTRQIEIMPDGRMDTENAAYYVGEAQKTMAIKRCNGTGPRFIKTGRIWYYKQDLDDWLASRLRVTSTAQDRTLNADIKARESSQRKRNKKQAEAREGA